MIIRVLHLSAVKQGENMRLICPNCDAQYEVDERVIPDGGRDVQCSNCGHAWFQSPETGEDTDTGTRLSPPPGPADDSHAEPSDADRPADTEPDAPDTKPDAPDAPDTPDAHGTGKDTGSDTGSDSPDATAAPQPTRRPLQDDVRDVLRAEAAREASARENERGSIETQEELGLTESPAARELRGLAAQERMARLRGLDTDDDAPEETSGARRDLLPDIEEINSSLAPIGSDEIVDDFAEPEPGKSGFGRGFFLMLILAAAIIALYVYAPLISAKIPALAPVLETYVAAMDTARQWLDDMVKLALSQMQSNGG